MSLLQRAVSSHRAGQLDVALRLYRSLLEQQPGNASALQLLGLVYSQRGEYDQAVALMRESLRLMPQQPEVANNLGNALFKRRRFDEAVQSYSLAIRLQPRYAEARRNLALCYLEQDQLDRAEACFQGTLELAPQDATAWLGLGNVHKQRENFESAIECYRKASALRPNYPEAHHNLGVCLRLLQRSAEALDHYEAARRGGLDRAELYHNIANARADCLDLSGAIDAYREALKRNPLNIDTHRNLNTLLWQQEHLDEYLQSYEAVLTRQQRALDLRVAYAVALNQRESYEAAERVLEEGLRLAPDASELKSLLAYTLEGQRRWPDALQMHAAAVSTPNSIPNHRVSFARALLACGRADEALKQAELAAAQVPFNQRALAYLGLCWRLLDDERDCILNDYDKLVQVYEVPVPVQFADAGEFNGRLGTLLHRLHVSKQHPAEQTLRGGTQTHGNLFDCREPDIQALVHSLKMSIEEYLSRLPRRMDHPLFARQTGEFDFAASWSVRLRRSGYHTMHVHPLGWISSAYYVEIPREISGSNAHGGELKFGEPDIDVGPRGVARRVIQPSVGRLVLFPSYMWHGTVPFESSEPRLTVAFDVVPRQPSK